MTFEFIISFYMRSEADIEEVLVDLLTRALEANLNEFETDAVAQMIQLRHYDYGFIKGSGVEILGFALEMPEETVSAKAVVQKFAGRLSDTPPIFHAVKFEDPLLQAELAERAKEIFILEMKLRRVLSLIYLSAYKSEDPFDLLRDETINLRPKPEPQQMRAASENQFFHLTFGQYAQLNQRKDLQTKDIFDIIRDSEKYNAFRAEILRPPVIDEHSRELIGDLKEIMDPIEQMRNCVAHNRQPTERLTQNYRNAHPRLEKLLEDYLDAQTIFAD